jgi:predicted transcriptional regulator
MLKIHIAESDNIKGMPMHSLMHSLTSRDALAHKMIDAGVRTTDELAALTGLSPNTVGAYRRGEEATMATIRSINDALEGAAKIRRAKNTQETAGAASE